MGVRQGGSIRPGGADGPGRFVRSSTTEGGGRGVGRVRARASRCPARSPPRSRPTGPPGARSCRAAAAAGLAAQRAGTAGIEPRLPASEPVDFGRHVTSADLSCSLQAGGGSASRRQRRHGRKPALARAIGTGFGCAVAIVTSMLHCTAPACQPSKMAVHLVRRAWAPSDSAVLPTRIDATPGPNGSRLGAAAMPPGGYGA